MCWGGVTSAGRVLVISDAPVGADLSGSPQAMWPDKPLALESAAVGQTQLAPDRPPLSPDQPLHHSQNLLAAATLTSPPRGRSHLLPLRHTATDSFWEEQRLRAKAQNAYWPNPSHCDTFRGLCAKGLSVFTHGEM